METIQPHNIIQIGITAIVEDLFTFYMQRLIEGDEASLLTVSLAFFIGYPKSC